jgi:hypothetical protein
VGISGVKKVATVLFRRCLWKLEEVEEVYARLGISRAAAESPRSFEEYAWKYGFKPQERRTRTALDAHTEPTEQKKVRASH